MSRISHPLRLFATGVLLSALLLAACNKPRSNSPFPPMPAGQASMIGKWHIDTVTTFFYNADGSLRANGVNGYPGKPDYYYHFNSDNSWQESFTPDMTSGLTMSGTYTLTSDSTFILTTPGAIPKDANLSCKILSISNSLFIFSKHAQTTYNGTEPGYIEYVFKMTK